MFAKAGNTEVQSSELVDFSARFRRAVDVCACMLLYERVSGFCVCVPLRSVCVGLRVKAPVACVLLLLACVYTGGRREGPREGNRILFWHYVCKTREAALMRNRLGGKPRCLHRLVPARFPPRGRCTRHGTSVKRPRLG